MGRHESHQQQIRREGWRRLQRSGGRGSAGGGEAPLQCSQLAAAVFVAAGLLFCIYIVLQMLLRQPRADFTQLEG